jgi:hypothetical protein
MTVNVGAMEFSALNAFNRRPLDTLSFSCDETSPVFRIAFLICATVKFGLTERRSPTTPVTCGVACEVPLKNS